MKKHLPNSLTILRIILIPFFFNFLINGDSVIAILLFFVACSTDFFDGFYARKYNATTNFGIFIDPLADKLLTTSAFIGFMFLDIFNLQLTWMMVAIIFTRDIIITLLRMIMEIQGITMITSKLGKVKTLLQMSAISYMLLILYMYTYKFMIYKSLLNSNSVYYVMVCTVLVTSYTGIHYLYYNKKSIKSIFLKVK